MTSRGLGRVAADERKFWACCGHTVSQRIHVWNVYLHWDYFKIL